MAADHGQSKAPPLVRECHPGIGLVVHEILAGQALDRLRGRGELLSGDAGQLPERDRRAGALGDVPDRLEVILRTIGQVGDVHASIVAGRALATAGDSG